MGRFDLSDKQWEKIAKFFEQKASKNGRPRLPNRPIVNGIFWILNTGASWRDLPERYGTWQTVYDRFNKWSKDGTITSVLECLQIELNELGLLDWSLFEVDSTSVRAHKSASGAIKKKD